MFSSDSCTPNLSPLSNAFLLAILAEGVNSQSPVYRLSPSNNRRLVAIVMQVIQVKFMVGKFVVINLMGLAHQILWQIKVKTLRHSHMPHMSASHHMVPRSQAFLQVFLEAFHPDVHRYCLSIISALRCLGYHRTCIPTSAGLLPELWSSCTGTFIINPRNLGLITLLTHCIYILRVTNPTNSFKLRFYWSYCKY